MTSDSIDHLFAPLSAVLAYGVYRLLRVVGEVAPSGISRLGTTFGTAAARVMRSSQYLSFKHYLPIAAATYVLLVGLLISFGTLTSEALVIGCPAVAIAVSYLVGRFRPKT
jgi:hypothetical protein